MEMNRDNETLESKMERLSNAHNGVYAQFLSFKGETTLTIDALMLLLENEIEDFKDKYKRLTLKLRIEQTVEARVRAFSGGDLYNYARFGTNLEALKAEAKEIEAQSLYHKTVRRTIKKLDEEFADIQTEDGFKIEQIVNMPVVIESPDTEEVIKDG